MATLDETAEHQLFLAEVHGDTLVVVPRGDAVGFTVQAVNTEQAKIREILQRDAVKHLVVDLGGANYFGSIVLGALMQMGQIIRRRQGRAALAGASSDMEDVLRLMKLNNMWELFPDRRLALRAIAAIPIAERLWNLRQAAAVLLAIAAVVLAIVFFPRTDYGRRYYVEISKLWRESLVKQQSAGEDEWERYLTRTEAKLQPMIDHMSRRSMAGRGTEAERYLTFIARDHWRGAFDRRSPDAKAHQRMVQHFLRCTEASLEHRPLPKGILDDDAAVHASQ
jgi:anti-anti-sigma factor